MINQVNAQTMEFFHELKELCQKHDVFIYGRDNFPDEASFEMAFCSDKIDVEIFKIDVNGGPWSDRAKGSNWVIFGDYDNQSVKVEF